jgi:hypothetical protein
MRQAQLSHEFVEFIPGEPEEGVLYISIPYSTVVHLCACGCGTKVVTPIGPADWKLTWDGDTVSLSPSVGNWQFACRSHYVINSNRVRWARPFTDEEIAAVHRRDARDLERYFASRLDAGADEPAAAPQKRPPARPSWLRRLFGRA